MIDPQSRSLEWIEQASGLIPNIADTALVEMAGEPSGVMTFFEVTSATVSERST